MTTISFSVEDDIKQDFDRWAKQAKKSKSDLFRDMVKSYQFNDYFDRVQDGMQKTLKELGIETEQELYDYLESDETYEDRIRHQRLSGRHQKG